MAIPGGIRLLRGISLTRLPPDFALILGASRRSGRRLVAMWWNVQTVCTVILVESVERVAAMEDRLLFSLAIEMRVSPLFPDKTSGKTFSIFPLVSSPLVEIFLVYS